jgi:hypothetical protein
MTKVDTILSRMDGIHKPRIKFMTSHIETLGSFQGRANLVNLHRYGAPHPRTAFRWFQREFDYLECNKQAIEAAGILKNDLALAIDATFLRKSGKKTHGVGYFHNGCSNKQERGLELSVIAAIDTTENTAYTLQAQQNLPKPKDGKVAEVIEQIKDNKETLQSISSMIIADGWYAKKKFVTSIVEMGFQLISKLRIDAKLQYLYTGAKKSSPGAKKKYDGFVDFDNVERFKKIEVDGAILYHKILRYKAFGRNLNVLRVHFQSKDHKSARFINLFSTDLELCPEKLFRLYRSRFQIEFLFRDAKQHLGLTDGQIRSENGVHHHCNLSLLATNVLRLKDREVQGKTKERIISLDAWKRKNYNRLLLKRIIVAFGIEAEVNKNKEKLQELINFGVNAA